MQKSTQQNIIEKCSTCKKQIQLNNQPYCFHTTGCQKYTCIRCFYINYICECQNCQIQIAKRKKKTSYGFNEFLLTEDNYYGVYYCCNSTLEGRILEMRKFLQQNCCIHGMNCPQIRKPLSKIQFDTCLTVGKTCYKNLREKHLQKIQKLTDHEVNILQQLNQLSQKPCKVCQQNKVNFMIGERYERQKNACHQCHKNKKIHVVSSSSANHQYQSYSNNSRYIQQNIQIPKPNSLVHQPTPQQINSFQKNQQSSIRGQSKIYVQGSINEMNNFNYQIDTQQHQQVSSKQKKEDNLNDNQGKFQLRLTEQIIDYTQLQGHSGSEVAKNNKEFIQSSVDQIVQQIKKSQQHELLMAQSLYHFLISDEYQRHIGLQSSDSKESEKSNNKNEQNDAFKAKMQLCSKCGKLKHFFNLRSMCQVCLVKYLMDSKEKHLM